MGLLWAAAVAVTVFAAEDLELGGSSFTVFLFVSLLLAVCGPVIYLGAMRMIAVASTMSLMELLRFNKEKVASFAGIYLVAIAYLFFLVDILDLTGNTGMS